MNRKKIAVILSGCGRGDGSEVHESVSVLIHLHRHGVEYRCFAPDAPQADVINHATGKPTDETRNQMVESARISRGEIAPVSSLNADAFDALVFPGGFGAAKNLCTFARDGADCTVNPDVRRVVSAFHAHRKPIALCCIAPVIAARLLGTAMGGEGCTVTIGSDEGTAQSIRRMGSTNVPKHVTEAYVDRDNRLVSTPAYMCDAGPYDVFTGIGKMIDELVAMVGQAPARLPAHA
ncbi:MAG: isoprenoid biosynthesis glyoxalase ElbB [Phycisphaerae bacterium]|nr:isoprenoid biosynthesis glyoxalase ElbB [Phycisphaerae bacterium]